MVETLYVDGTNPTVFASSPAAGASSVQPPTTLTFTFDEAMDASLFSSSSLSITGGTITFAGYDENTKTAAFTVSGLLKHAAYTAILSGLRDLAGNSLTSSTAFTTVPFTVTFNGNGATSGTVPAAATADTVTLPVQSDCLLFKKRDAAYYKFKGWATTSDATATITDTTYTPTSDVTLYAIWSDLEVGDRGPGGGWIFIANSYISNETDPDGGWKYMEAGTQN
ncbi:MAG: Ig-like domain-containing protein, partial [Spirochaetota bacterium]